MDNIKENVSKNLAALRKKRKLTQSELAERFDYTDKAVSKWEKGDALPDIETLQQLADFYGVTLDYLTHEATTENKKLYAFTKTNHFNKRVIVGLAVSLVWILAIVACIGCLIINGFLFWRAFVWALPASCFVCLGFNFFWGPRDARKYLEIFLVWTLLVAIYLELGCDLPGNQGWRLWMIFLLGIPATAGAVLWSHLKTSPEMTETKN